MDGNRTVFRSERYVLGIEDGLPFIIIDGERYDLTCHPYEPCLYITDRSGRKTAVHNSFDPCCVLDSFQKGECVTSITGFTYDAEDFCRMVEYAAGRYDIQIDDAEKVFGSGLKKKTKGKPVTLLQTDRLILRNYSMDDVPAVHEYFSNEEVSRYEDFRPMTVEEVAEGLSEWKDMDNRMAVVLKETGELIGSAGYWVDYEGGETEYSIDFDFNPRFWHRGYALEAAGEVVRHLKEDLHVTEIRADCDERNTASSRLLERLGFKLLETVDDAYKEDADGNPIMIRSRVYKLNF